MSTTSRGTPERPPGPRPATEARPDDLLELTHGLRRELLARGEFLPSTWVEEAANDLKAGRLRGWIHGANGGPPGLAFFSPRSGRAYGHVHVTAGPNALGRARELLGTLRDALGASDPRLDVGLTGLTETEEDALRASADSGSGESALLRLAMEVRLASDLLAPRLPAGLRQVRVREFSLNELARVDWMAYQGTADESLVADSPAEDARVLAEIQQGLLGRFLDEASTVLVSGDGGLAGFLFTAEQTPQRGVFLDLVVRPDLRQKGIGGFLLRWGMRALLALGYSSARLWVTESNAPARALYQGLGFRPAGRAVIYRFRPVVGAPASVPQAHSSR